MSELNCFIDESGLTNYLPHSPFYVVTFVFHDQSNSIHNQIAHLEHNLLYNNQGLKRIHTRPMIRNSKPYEEMPLNDRRYLISQLFMFAKKSRINYRYILIDRRKARSVDELKKCIERELSAFIDEKTALFQAYDSVIVSYDNGQKMLSQIVTQTFESKLSNSERRHVDPVIYREYRLAQIADLFCSLELTAARYEHNMVGRKEDAFFKSKRDFTKNYLKPLRKMLI